MVTCLIRGRGKQQRTANMHGTIAGGVRRRTASALHAHTDGATRCPIGIPEDGSLVFVLRGTAVMPW